VLHRGLPDVLGEVGWIRLLPPICTVERVHRNMGNEASPSNRGASRRLRTPRPPPAARFPRGDGSRDQRRCSGPAQRCGTADGDDSVRSGIEQCYRQKPGREGGLTIRSGVETAPNAGHGTPPASSCRQVVDRIPLTHCCGRSAVLREQSGGAGRGHAPGSAPRTTRPRDG
jgi:hypothetical protein